MVKLAQCGECHTPGPVYHLMKELEFGGGTPINIGSETVASANITSDPSGISYYDEAQFVATIRSGRVGARQLSSVMPWWFSVG